MSYSITSGNAQLARSEDHGGFEITIARASHPDAPCFDADAMTGSENHRHPAYSTWHFRH